MNIKQITWFSFNAIQTMGLVEGYVVFTILENTGPNNTQKFFYLVSSLPKRKEPPYAEDLNKIYSSLGEAQAAAGDIFSNFINSMVVL